MSIKKSSAVFLSLLLLSQAIVVIAGPPCGPHRWGGWGPDGKALFWTNFGLTVGTLALGTIVSYLPPERTVVVNNGTTYYNYGNAYFTETQGGYVVVAAPFVIPPPPPPTAVVFEHPVVIAHPIPGFHGQPLPIPAPVPIPPPHPYKNR